MYKAKHQVWHRGGDGERQAFPVGATLTGLTPAQLAELVKIGAAEEIPDPPAEPLPVINQPLATDLSLAVNQPPATDPATTTEPDSAAPEPKAPAAEPDPATTSAADGDEAKTKPAKAK